MKPKILLLNPPGKYLYVRDYFCSKISKADYINAPIDLVMISGVLNTGEFDLKVIDAVAEKIPTSACFQEISGFNPDAIIILIGSASLAEDKEFLKNLKEKTSAEIFVIGDFLLTESKSFLEEFAFIKGVILNFISDGIYWQLKKEKEKIKDMAVREGVNIIFYPKSAAKSFSVNMPLHEQFIKKPYRMPFVRKYPFATTIMSYACPYRCTFCVMNTLPYVERDLDNLFAELDYLKSLGVKEILFLDQTIGLNRNRHVEFLKRMIDKNYCFGWFGFTSVDVIDEEIMKMMKKAGCHTLWFGVETSSDETLRAYGKGYTKKQVLGAFAVAKKVGIKTLATFLIGLPEETKETIEDTIKFSKELNPDYASFSFAGPGFGAKIRGKAVKSGLVSDNDKTMDQSGRRITMGTISLSKRDMQKLKRKAILGFYLRPSYILKRLRSLKSFTELKINWQNFLSLIKNEI